MKTILIILLRFSEYENYVLDFGQVSEVMQKPKYCKVTYSKLLKIIQKFKW